MSEELKLNIGASYTYIPGFANIDLAPHADITLDLSKDPLPFEDSSVDLVFSLHTLEHIPNYLLVLREIHRVLKHGAPLLVGLPYVTLTYYHQINPYHLHDFNEASFDFFEPGKLRSLALDGDSPAFRVGFHRFHYMGVFHLLPMRGWCRRHLLNVVRSIDFGLVALKGETPVEADARALRAEFDRCLAARVRYKPRPRPRLRRRLRLWWQGHVTRPWQGYVKVP